MMKQNGLTMMSMMRNLNRTTVMTSITRCLLLLTMLLWVSPVMAQKDPKATVEAMRVLIRNFNDRRATVTFAEELAEKFKNNPEVLCGLGHAYWWSLQDSVQAYKFLKKALGADANYQKVVKGLVLLAAVIFDVVSKQNESK